MDGFFRSYLFLPLFCTLWYVTVEQNLGDFPWRAVVYCRKGLNSTAILSAKQKIEYEETASITGVVIMNVPGALGGSVCFCQILKEETKHIREDAV